MPAPKDPKKYEEWKQRIRESTKKAWSNPERRKRQSDVVKKAMSNPELRKRLSEAHKGHHNSPKTEFKKGNIPWHTGTKGIHLSPKTEFKKGLVSWNKGKKHTQESLLKMSESHKKTMSNLEVKRRMSEAQKRRMFNPEERRKLSESHKGQIPWITGKKHTPESLLKMSKSHKGKLSPMKGKKHSEESLKKMSVARKGKPAWNKGIPMREESKLKISGKNNPRYGKPAWNKGKHPSPEILKKLSESHKGQVAWNKGVPMNEKSRKKMSEIQKGLYAEGKRIPPMKGKHLSEELRKKIGESTKKAMSNPEVRKKLSETHKGRHLSPKTQFKKGHIPWTKGRIGTFHHSEETKRKLKVHRATQVFPLKDSLPEIKIQNFLQQAGISFLKHKYIKEIEHSYQCDILIPLWNLIIEVDGDYWHKYPIGKEIDHTRTKELMEKGFKVLRIWGSEIKTMTLKDFMERLEKAK